MRTALLLAAALLAIAPPTGRAQGPAAPYQRTRTGANAWHARGGDGQNWRGGHRPGGGYGGFYNPYYAAAPLVVGSYYQRPYPYHFDYYRDRWATPPNGAGVEPTLMQPDCPCAVPPPVEVVQ